MRKSLMPAVSPERTFTHGAACVGGPTRRADTGLFLHSQKQPYHLPQADIPNTTYIDKFGEAKLPWANALRTASLVQINGLSDASAEIKHKSKFKIDTPCPEILDRF